MKVINKIRNHFRGCSFCRSNFSIKEVQTMNEYRQEILDLVDRLERKKYER